MSKGLLDHCLDYLTQEMRLNSKKAEIVRFGMECAVSVFTSIGTALIAGRILGQFWETVLTLAIFAALRRFSGGSHCTAPGRCALFTALVLAMVAGQARWLFWAGFQHHYLAITAVTLLAVVIHYRWAPADCPAHPIANPVRRQRFKRLSLAAIAVLASFLFLITYLGNGLYAGVGWVSLLWHSLGITPWGNKAVAGADRLLAAAGIRR